ncbi:MAG: SUMF1/EgtB/PvdO family nonheme iron enzyme [Sphingomonadales bacterium]|nr:SUMF1/EgtB/PvdO family nonheme iron enzyme [Sphingomonadales bacterium]
MTKLSNWLRGIILIGLLVPASCSANTGNNSSSDQNGDKISVLNLCHECPVFIGVPKAESPRRPIVFVSKFELTWNNYLAAVDAGRCAIPNPNSGHRPAGENDLLLNIENLRIDWPIGVLGAADVECYIGWLQEKTGYIVSLPTGDEWEWFARSGKEKSSFLGVIIRTIAKRH